MIPGDTPRSGPPSSRFTGTVGRLTLVNISVSLLGAMSGIVQARALGPEGRGELAAILVPLYFVAFLGDLGLGLYARREAARTNALGDLIGTIGPTVGTFGVVLCLALLPLVGLVARGRSVVHLWLSLGLLFVPLQMMGNVLLSVVLGLERWSLWIRSRLLVAGGWVVVLGALYALGRLSVQNAVATYLGMTMASYLPLLPVLRDAGPIRFRPGLMQKAVPFGARAWLAGFTNLANTRLDQLVMVGVVSSRQLGLYAVAVTLAAVPSNFSGAVALGILPRVVRDGHDLVPRAVRLSLLVVLVGSASLAVVAWPAVHFVIGHRFTHSLPMIWILLLAEVPLAGTVTLGQAFIGSGRPGQTACAEGLALVVTVAGLAVALSALGGVGAALVSLAAYSVAFSYLLIQSHRISGHRLGALLVPTRGDATWTKDELRRLLAGRHDQD